MQHLEDFVSLTRLDELSTKAFDYKTASPFPHLVIDNFLNQEICQQLMQDFPGPDDVEWHRFKAKSENDKLQSTSELSVPASIRTILNEFNSATFIKFLEKLTGIKGIIPDPHMYGGGMHQTLNGGYLGMHVDYNKHVSWNLDRRINLLLYLNEGWEEDWGGALELWDKDMQSCIKKVYPIANRVVIFSTTEHSWHGHPDPLRCPNNRTRKSIALYYYSNGRPEEEIAEEHGTIFQARPGEIISEVELVPEIIVEEKATPTPIWKKIVREITPPIIIKTAKKILA